MIKKAATLRDLAKALGLSTATVSRALNGFPEVKEQTRIRVEAAAAQMGYRPNISARNLANGQVNAVGLVPRKEAGGFIDPLLAEFLDGVTSVTAENGVILSLPTAQDNDTLDAYRSVIAGRAVDAFIVSSPDVVDKRVAELIKARFPFVLHGRTQADAPFWSYDIDNYDGFYRATHLLIDYGHRKIAFIGGRMDARFTVDRLNGTQDALREKGLNLPEQNICYGEMTEHLGYVSGLRYLSLPAERRPSAFLCLNIYVAMGLLRASRERGLSCPADFSIIVHDDRAPYLRAEFSDPPLTAVQSSIRSAGIRVAEMVMNMLRDLDAKPKQIIEPVELVLRQSVALVTP